jgi:hypothetical protein
MMSGQGRIVRDITSGALRRRGNQRPDSGRTNTLGRRATPPPALDVGAASRTTSEINYLVDPWNVQALP